MTAAHSAGATQDFSLSGNFGAGPHAVAVNFVNDLWDGSASTDRNLYVQAIALNGVVSTENSAQLAGGAVSYQVNAPTDKLTLHLSEDAYKGDAQFVVSIDGQQQGGVQTIVASHAMGQTQSFSYRGPISPPGTTSFRSIF